MTQKKLTDEINPLETDLRKLTLNHREAELELRGRKFRLETEVEGLIAKYDDVSRNTRYLSKTATNVITITITNRILVHDNTARRN